MDSALNLLREVKLVEIKSRRLSDQTMAGSYRSAFKGHGMSFAEVREYQAGDEVRAIDWNVTARTGRPHVKLYEEERELTVMLLVDLSRSLDFGTREKTARRLVSEIVATLAFSALKNGDKVGAIFFTDRVEKFIPPAKSRRHVLRIVSDLLSFRPEGHETRLAPALEYLVRALRKRCIAFLISDFMDSADYSLPLSVAARKHDLLSLHVFDPFMAELPDVGLLRVRDAETGRQMLLDTSSPRQRASYARWWRQHSHDLTQRMSRAGVDTASLPTNRDYAAPLRRLLQRLALFLCLLLPGGILQAQNVVEASLDTTDILIGEQVQLSLSVKTDKGRNVEFPDYPPQGEMVPGVEVIGATPVDSTDHNDGARLQLSRRYTITSFDSALYALRPYVVIDGDTLPARTSVGLKVTSVPVDTLHPENMADPYGPVEADFEWNLWFWLALLFVPVAIVGGLFLLRKARNLKAFRKRIPIPRPPSPLEKLEQSLRPLEGQELFSQEDYKAFYVALTQALRTFIADRFGIAALEMTTSQILARLTSLSEAEGEDLRELLQTADLVKFARQQTSSDAARRYLERTRRFAAAHTPQGEGQDAPKERIVVETNSHLLRRKRRLQVVAAALFLLAAATLVWIIVEIVALL